MDQQKKQQMNPKDAQQKNYPGTKDQQNELIDQEVDEDEDENENGESLKGESQGTQPNKQNRGFGQEDQGRNSQQRNPQERNPQERNQQEKNPKNQGQQQHPDDARKRDDVFQQRDKKDPSFKGGERK